MLKKPIIPTLFLFIMFSLSAVAQVTEDFETGYAAGDTRFNDPSGKTFDFTSDFRIANVSDIGANSSDWFFDTGFQGGNTNTPPSAIVSTDTNLTFEVLSMYMWTSADDGVSEFSGPVTFTGTIAGGATVSETINIAPTGPTGADWVFVDFTGTNLDGAQLKKIEFTYGGAINYLAGDDFRYILSGPTGIDNEDTNNAIAFPNPTDGKLRIDLKRSYQAVHVQVKNMMGQTVFTQTHAITNAINLNLDQQAGLYFVEITSKEGSVETLKILKQ